MKRLALSLFLLFATFLLFTPINYAGETVLYTFKGGTDGYRPFGTLVADTAGNLYGTTYYGGDESCNIPYGCGTAFELSPDGHGAWAETVLYRFTGHADGQNPFAGLTLDSQGNLYGTTGGAVCPPKCGSAFELSPGTNGWTLTVLHTFLGKKDGGGPAGGLAMDAKGNLYGTTIRDGAGGYGTVFQLSRSGNMWVLKTLHAFALDQNGSDPQGSLVVDPAGATIYGAASYGGSDGYGVVYGLALNSKGRWTEKVLHTFPGGKSGGNPTFGLSSDSAGNLYGIATNTTSRFEMVYQLLPNSQHQWTERTIYHFNTQSSGQPDAAAGNVLIDQAGNVFGFGGGGKQGKGTIYELAESGGKWTEALLFAFQGYAGGTDPFGTPIMDANGNLYGVTTEGGAGCSGLCGVVFEFAP
jgi:uncharacterized repeat protein (TIGR03803 family)